MVCEEFSSNVSLQNLLAIFVLPTAASPTITNLIVGHCISHKDCPRSEGGLGVKPQEGGGSGREARALGLRCEPWAPKSAGMLMAPKWRIPADWWPESRRKKEELFQLQKRKEKKTLLDAA